jgi:hypothetical protein
LAQNAGKLAVPRPPKQIGVPVAVVVQVAFRVHAHWTLNRVVIFP